MIRKWKRQNTRRTVGRAVFPRNSTLRTPRVAPEHAGFRVTFSDSLVFRFAEGITPRGIGKCN